MHVQIGILPRWGGRRLRRSNIQGSGGPIPNWRKSPILIRVKSRGQGAWCPRAEPLSQLHPSALKQVVCPDFINYGRRCMGHTRNKLKTPP